MQIYNDRLLLTIQNLVTQHHTIYPWLPPQGIFFEALAERAFHLSGEPDPTLLKLSQMHQDMTL